MEIIVNKSFSGCNQVDFVDGSTKIDLGFLNKDERKILAETLLSAVYDLCHNDMPTEDYYEWVKENA